MSGTVALIFFGCNFINFNDELLIFITDNLICGIFFPLCLFFALKACQEIATDNEYILLLIVIVIILGLFASLIYSAAIGVILETALLLRLIAFLSGSLLCGLIFSICLILTIKIYQRNTKK